MRTNILIDDELMIRALQVSGLSTKRAAVEAGLRLLIQVHAQTEIRNLRGKVRWQGDLDAQRIGRFAEEQAQYSEQDKPSTGDAK